MPYHWQTETGEAPDFSGVSFYAQGDPPLARLHLCAHNSLSPKGFVAFVGVTFALVLMPLVAVLGSPVLWGLLPFILAMLAGLWWALKRSWADGAVREELSLWSDRVTLRHMPGRGAEKHWEANAFWAVPHLDPRRGKLRNYITLTGGADGREVELGRFLDPEERAALYGELVTALRQAPAQV